MDGEAATHRATPGGKASLGVSTGALGHTASKQSGAAAAAAAVFGGVAVVLVVVGPGKNWPATSFDALICLVYGA